MAFPVPVDPLPPPGDTESRRRGLALGTAALVGACLAAPRLPELELALRRSRSRRAGPDR